MRPTALGLILSLACVPLGACGAAVGPNASNSAKMGEALGFAAVAGAAQVAQEIAQERARNSGETNPASPPCDDVDHYGQYACVTLGSTAASARPPEAEMTDAQARDYVRDYVNGVRKLNGAGPLSPDAALEAFAQAGSEELSVDHQPGLHLAAHASELGVRSAEIQGAPDGAPPALVQDILGALLVGTMDEGPGGVHREKLLGRDWTKLGVGIAKLGHRTYVTLDLSE
jgi:hypothetical protein